MFAGAVCGLGTHLWLCVAMLLGFLVSYGLTSMQDYKSPRPVVIHYPPSSYMDESLRRSVVGDLPGVRLPREIALLQDSYLNESPRVFTLQGTRLNLRLLNKVRLLKGAHLVMLLIQILLTRVIDVANL